MADTTLLSLNDTAKLTGRAKSTISKALKNGKMSYVSKNQDTGQYQIEPSEALRVFPKRKETVSSDQKETQGNAIENSVLQVKLEAAEQRYGDAEKTIEDLRERLSKSDDERTRLAILLTDQRPAEPKRKWWPFS